MRPSLAVFAFLAASAVAPRAAAADASYPTRPVRLIVTFAPGGATDTVSRSIAAKLAEAWKTPVVVDNRAGGGGIIGTEIAAKAAPDGHTLLVGTSAGLIANPLLRAKLPYDTFRDFAPISFLFESTQLLVVHPSIPATSVTELVSYLKSYPGKLSYASAGIGAPNHLGMELFKSMTGTSLVHVPYKGSGLSVTDLLTGQIQVMFNPAAPMLPHVKTGRLRALAVGNEKRSRVLPDLPTVSEAGVPGFSNAAWSALYAPSRTPVSIINALNAQVLRSLGDEAFAQQLVSNGAEPRTSTPRELTAFMRHESERLRKVIVTANIRAE